MMHRKYLVRFVLVLMSVVAGVGVGRYWFPLPGVRPASAFIDMSDEQAEGRHLNACGALRRYSGLDVVSRANAMAARSMIVNRRTSQNVGPFVYGAVLFENLELDESRSLRSLTIWLLEPYAESSSAVFLFRASADGPYVRCKYPTPKSSDASRSREIHTFHPPVLHWVDPKELANRGTLGSDGMIHVPPRKDAEGNVLIEIPRDAKVAVGFEYPDGTYTNFVSLCHTLISWHPDYKNQSGPLGEPPVSIWQTDEEKESRQKDLEEYHKEQKAEKAAVPTEKAIRD
jgi:hypothetical protein